ncbi:hypothetical protein ABID80_000981 [Streptomyces sp. PvP037]
MNAVNAETGKVSAARSGSLESRTLCGGGGGRSGAWDADPLPPQPLDLAVDREDGRGLALVRACADVWGWQPLAREGGRGKYVWCEPGTTPEPARRTA